MTEVFGVENQNDTKGEICQGALRGKQSWTIFF